MESRIITPRRILLAIAVIIALFLLRTCLCNPNDNGKNKINEVNIRYDAPVTNLNPFQTVVGTDIFTCARIFLSLGELEPKTLELSPTLVKKIPEVRPVTDGPHAGQLAYDFEILPEAVWDNGSPVTGNDMLFVFKTIYNPVLDVKAFASYLKDMNSIEVDPANPKKFTVYFNRFYILAIETLCMTPMLPAYNYDPAGHMAKFSLEDLRDPTKSEALKNDPDIKAYAEEFKSSKFANDPNGVSGCGPYRLAIINDQGAILEKKDNWWGDKLASQNPNLRAFPKRLVYKVIKDEIVVENMLKNGELDIVAGSFSPAKFLELQKNDSITSKYNFDLLPALQYNRWLFNLSKPIVNDVRVRKALAHLIDYDHFIKNIRMNLAERVVGPILPSKSYYAKDLPLYDFNIQKAKDLLAEAGWADSNKDGILDKMENGKRVNLTLEVLTQPVKTSQQYAESVTETCRLAGIEIKAVTYDIQEVNKRSKEGNFQTTFLGSAFFPGLTDLTQRYHSSNIAPHGDNRAAYVNTKFDTLITNLAAEPDPAKRNPMYIQAQTILNDELPEVFIFAPKQVIITSKRFTPVVTANRPGYYEQMFELK